MADTNTHTLCLQSTFSPAPSSLQLRDPERRRAGKVQEEGTFLFGQEGGRDDVVDARWDVFSLHVAEATSGKRHHT